MTDEAERETAGREGAPGEGQALHVLALDAPNVDAVLASFLGRKPEPADRPDFKALRAWFVEGAGSEATEACVFVNVPEDRTARQALAGWIQWLKTEGFQVFGRPKHNGEGDIDDAVAQHLRRRNDEGHLRRVVLVSNDAKAFLPVLLELAGQGVQVQVLGFTENAGDLAARSEIEFIDLEDVPGVFAFPVPGRVRLDRLPPEGAWL